MGATAVLVHGAFHGPWCWERVAPSLAARGIRVQLVELPFSRFKHDVAVLRRAIRSAGGPAVVCAHSYGGLVATLAASGEASVRSLVYIAAFMLDLREPDAAGVVKRLIAEHPLTFGDVVDRRLARRAFYDDCPDDDAARALERLRPMSASTRRWWLMRELPPPAFATAPSAYVVCSADRALSPAAQRQMAARATCQLELACGHAPFYARPRDVAAIVGAACGRPDQ